MNLQAIPAELVGGPRDGLRVEVMPFVGQLVDTCGKYIRGDEKTEKGRVIFRWIFNQEVPA